DPAAAANNLHQAVYVARRALALDAIQVRDEMLQLRAEVDVDRLEIAAAEARRMRTPSAYRAAVALYHGELLPENRYEDWVQERREQLAELAEELAEESAALASDGVLSLPANVSSFIGRLRELRDLTTLIGRTRLLTLTGLGGVGKTRMALELARAAAPRYTDGAALVELAALEDPELVPDAVAAAIEVQASGQSIIDAVSEYLAPRSTLIIVDNCEHVLGASARLVETLLQRAPGLSILTTSREPLRVPGEVVFRVPSLDIADPERSAGPDELLEYEAVHLFVERARAAASGFALDEENAADVARICFRLDGVPLALELAAGRLGGLDPAAIAQRLDDRFRVLRGADQNAPSRQRTLTATIEWSHDLLASDEQTLFRRLAIFSGGFELEAAEQVCGDEKLGVYDIAALLGRLVEKSMVARDASGSGERRYRLLETVRAYALERLEEASERVMMAERHAGWAVALAEEWRGSPRLDPDAANLRTALDTLLDREPQRALRFCVVLLPFWLRRIDLKEASRSFEQALAAVPEPGELRAQALLSAASIDFRSGAVLRGIERTEESHATAAAIGDRRGRWRSLQLRAEFALASDAVDAAIPRLERALELARREALGAAEATSLHSLGIAYWMLGDLERAEQLLADSVHRFDGLADSFERINSPINYAETIRGRGRRGLRIVFEDTLQPFAEISCAAAAGYALANWSGIARARADFARAHVLIDESEGCFRQIGDRAGQAAALVRRAYLEFAEGELERSRRSLEEAHGLRHGLGDRRGSGIALAGLGLIHTAAGDYTTAERELADAAAIFKRAGDRWGLAITLWRIADLRYAQRGLDAAEAALEEARRVLGPTQRERWIANTIAGLAEIALERRRPDRAVALFQNARRRYAARRDKLGVQDVDERLRAIADARSPGNAASATNAGREAAIRETAPGRSRRELPAYFTAGRTIGTGERGGSRAPNIAIANKTNGRPAFGSVAPPWKIPPSPWPRTQ
ncbi:MAG: tetratricopeptide repeat protein, partial [Solirubrobacterales bacterium]|nr:tetratricopeptide repeat protein [Solirubrobacterales bacterium]